MGGCGSSPLPAQPLPVEPWVEAGMKKEHYDHIVAEFVMLDTGGDNQISRDEFQQASRLTEFLGMGSDDIGHLFAKIDLDHNGYLKFEEFLAYMKTRKDHFALPCQINPEKQRLESNMQQLGFNLCKTDAGLGVPGDGNCQFSSLSWHLFSTTTKAGEVRAKVVDQLRGDAGDNFRAFYAPELPSLPQTFDDYLDYMAKDKTWGDQMTLQTAASLYNLKLRLLTSSRYDASAVPASDFKKVGGRKYGCMQVLLPMPERAQRPKDIYLAFAASHYSPIQKSKKTPTVLKN